MALLGSRPKTRASVNTMKWAQKAGMNEEVMGAYLLIRHKAHVQLAGRPQELNAVAFCIQMSRSAHILAIHHSIVISQPRPLVQLQPALVYFIARVIR
jgi:hypothetical protein